jgi:cysteinyl-tRNA synthetase
MPFVLRDSLSGQTRPLEARPGRPFTIYACGPTVYDVAHVGHARTYLYFDLLRRALEFDGTRVHHVMNLTDYEDKISARAEALGIPWRLLAEREIRRFHADMDGLGVLRPHDEPRASDFVGPMIAVAKRLEKTGHVTRRGNAWIYCPPSASGRNFPIGEEFLEHTVPEPDLAAIPSPEMAREIVVWNLQEPPRASWPSPWGRGAPGWHLECYAMARDLLGIPVDLHGGGIDLLFPHHYAGNEVALALDGTLFARTFLHLGFVTQLHRKMSKSRGNLVPIGPALDQYGRDGLRWYLLGRRYNARLEWEPQAAEAAAAEWSRVRRTYLDALGPSAGSIPADDLEGLLRQVFARVQHGLRVDAAWQELREFALALDGAGRPGFRKGDQRRARAALRRLERLLGLSVLRERSRGRDARDPGDRG